MLPAVLSDNPVSRILPPTGLFFRIPAFCNATKKLDIHGKI